MWDGCAGECSRCRATRASEETDERPLHTMHARGRPDVRERWRTLSGADRRRHAPGGAERVRFGNPERHERGTGLEPRGPHLYLWVDHAQLPSTSALNADEGGSMAFLRARTRAALRAVARRRAADYSQTTLPTRVRRWVRDVLPRACRRRRTLLFFTPPRGRPVRGWGGF